MSKLAKYFVIAMLLSAALWLTACEWELSGSERTAVLGFSEALTDNLFAGLNANDYAVFSRDFDIDMERELPVTAFPAWKEDLDNKLGSYLDRRVDQVKRADEFYVVDYKVRFEKADPVKFTVVFHSSEGDRIAVVGFESEPLSWSAFEKD